MQATHAHSKESLRAIDLETLIDMYILLDAKFQHLDSRFQLLADHARELIANKYGPTTERFENPDQLLIFPDKAAATNHSDSADEEPSSAAATKNVESKKKKKPGHQRNPQPDLPKVPVFAPMPEEAKNPCACCGATLVPVRQILQNTRKEYVPASFYLEELYSVVYGCSSCESNKEITSKVPEAVENGQAGPGLLAQVGVARDYDHQPFNRQSEIYKRSGVNLSRSTLCDHYAQLATILKPLYDFMHVTLLQSKVISTDDTPVKVLDRSKDKNIKRGRKWIYMGDKDHAVNLFDYTQGRGRDGPLTFLKGWTGFLQGDCFSGNLAVCAAIGTILVACLAHARRYFIKSLLNDKEGSNHALAMFQSLYEIESTAKELNLSSDGLRVMREEEAVPKLETFHAWLQKQYAVVPPKSSFGKTLFYCLNNWNELNQYVKDGDLSIDNNHSEREMKYIAMGRKAWLFFGSDQGGENHAIVLSILSTCRRHGVEPWAYLKDVIQRLTDDPAINLEELLPYNWKPQKSLTPVTEITVVKDAPKLRCA
jgi:Transposase and inactivated derivatives